MQEFHTIRAQKAASERADTGASSLGAGGEEEEDGADAEDGGAQRGGPGAKGSQQADQEKDDEDESEEEDEEGAKADERRKGRNDAATTARDADDTAAAGEESSSSDEEEEEGGERRGGAGAASESESDEDAAPAAGKGGKGAGTKAKGGKGSASAAKGKGKDAKKPAARITAMRKSSGIVTSLDMVRNSVESDDRTGTLTATVALEIGSPKLLMLDIAQRAAAAAIVRQTPRIKKCYVLEEGGWRVQTDGVNFQAAWKQARRTARLLPDRTCVAPSGRRASCCAARPDLCGVCVWVRRRRTSSTRRRSDRTTSTPCSRRSVRRRLG